ncbi:MAG TPA: allantoinase AllB [Stellaceae bacterium]|nr:allantoinase AllB [Stellaceae bacterium]
MSVDLVISGGTLVTETAAFPASVAVADGRIAAIGRDDAMPPAAERLDARGLHVLPGAIDAHVHIREPGYTHKEDWATGTAAAACGGVTTIFDMPNTNPPTGTREALAMKLAAAEEKAFVDFGIYGLLDENNIDGLETLIEGGVAAFKCFMGNTFGNLPAPSDGAMLEGFEILARRGLRCTVHAETASILARREAKMRDAGRHDPLAHLAARPPVAAMEAVQRAALYAEWTGARLHIAHVSSSEELRPLREAKSHGVDVTAETCPHYLMLDTEDYARCGSLIRVNPPVREPYHKALLWAAVRDRTIDMISTDHAPHTPDEKHRDDIWTADCGFPGVESQMPLMLTAVANGEIAITDYVRLSSAAPARAFGLYPKKGALIPGADADLALVDLAASSRVDRAMLHSLRAQVTPFHGRALKGVPIHTLVRGRFVMRERELVSDARGWGQSVRRVQEMPPPRPRNTAHTTAAILKLPD